MRTKILLGALAMVMALVVAACSSAAPAAAPAQKSGESSAPAAAAPKERKTLSIATATTGGTFYVWGAAVANVLRSFGGSVDAVSQTSQGSNENVKLLPSKQVDMAVVQADVLYQTYNGLSGRDKVDTLRGLYAGLPMAFYVVLPKDSSANTLLDLKGQTIGVPTKGQGGYTVTEAVFDALGLKFEDFKEVRYGSVPDLVSMYKDRHVDAIMMTGGVPQPAFMELPSSPRGMKLANFTDDQIAKIKEKLPYYAKTTIPLEAYPGMVRAATAPTIWMGLVVNADMADDTAYQVVKTLAEHQKDLEAAYSGAVDSTPQNTVEYWQNTPLHPGSKKYLTEKGYLK